jgi:hypothetical protein
LEGDEDHRNTGTAYPGEFAERKNDTAFVLVQDANGNKEIQDDEPEDRVHHKVMKI